MYQHGKKQRAGHQRQLSRQSKTRCWKTNKGTSVRLPLNLVSRLRFDSENVTQRAYCNAELAHFHIHIMIKKKSRAKLRTKKLVFLLMFAGLYFSSSYLHFFKFSFKIFIFDLHWFRFWDYFVFTVHRILYSSSIDLVLNPKKCVPLFII